MSFYKAALTSKKAVLLIAVLLPAYFFIFNIWEQNRIQVDAPSYYAYLPSVFIHHDLSLSYVDENPEFFKDKIWFTQTPEGKRIIKHPMGLSVMLLPFFLAGHLCASLFSNVQDGYSLWYQNALSIGILVYLVLALWFLGKVLLSYFPEYVVALTLITIVFGTNLLYYSSYEGLMNHTASFCMTCLSMNAFFQWMQTGKRKHAYYFAVFFGLMLLLRPLSVALLVYFISAAIFFKGTKGFFPFVQTNFQTIAIAGIIILLIFFPQLLYWKAETGHWYYDAYPGEHFYFNRPEISGFLFSFNKGWLIYSPLMLFALAGLVVLYRTRRALFAATLLSLVCTIYIFSSWWAWNYGYCFGMRPMIDSYSLLSIPLAASFSACLSKGKIIHFIFYAAVSLLITLNLFQTWQYANGLINPDMMTRKAYIKGFLQTSPSEEWYDLLRPFNFHRRELGQPQQGYDKNYLERIKTDELIYLRGSNLLFLSVNNPFHAALCSGQSVGNTELFRLVRLGGDTVAIQSYKGKFFQLKYERRNALAADTDSLTITGKFILKQVDEDDNKITLQALNGSYVSFDKNRSNLLRAAPAAMEASAVFRLFVLEK